MSNKRPLFGRFISILFMENSSAETSCFEHNHLGCLEAGNRQLDFHSQNLTAPYPNL
jgi:hypothetical protein